MIKTVADIFFAVICVVGCGILVMMAMGFRFMTVETGSMGDACPAGSLVITAKADGEDIETGDIISFMVNENGTVVTHRVIAADRENKCFYTQGDANNVTDSRPVVYENVVGRVVCTLRGVGNIISFLRITVVRVILITFIAFVLLWEVAKTIIRAVRARRQ